MGRKPPVMSLSREIWADGAMPAHISGFSSDARHSNAFYISTSSASLVDVCHAGDACGTAPTATKGSSRISEQSSTAFGPRTDSMEVQEKDFTPPPPQKKKKLAKLPSSPNAARNCHLLKLGLRRSMPDSAKGVLRQALLVLLLECEPAYPGDKNMRKTKSFLRRIGCAHILESREGHATSPTFARPLCGLCRIHVDTTCSVVPVLPVRLAEPARTAEPDN